MKNDDYGNGNRLAFMEMASKNNVTTWTTQVNTFQTDFTSQINEMHKTGIRILVFLVQTNEAIKMFQQIKYDYYFIRCCCC